MRTRPSRIYIVILVIVVSVIANAVLVYLHFNPNCGSMTVHHNHAVPRFEGWQVDVVKKTAGTVAQQLEDPTRWYVSGIHRSDSRFFVHLSPIGNLQSAIARSPKCNDNTVALDGNWKRFVFSKKYELTDVTEAYPKLPDSIHVP